MDGHSQEGKRFFFETHLLTKGFMAPILVENRQRSTGKVYVKKRGTPCSSCRLDKHFANLSNNFLNLTQAVFCEFNIF